MQFPKVKAVTAIKSYLLHIVFTDGIEGNYEISHLAGKGVFKSWDIDNNFYNVFVNPESGAISWSDETDIDTINVYCAIKGINADDYLIKAYHATY
jgi:hypothetical protein